MSIALPVVIFLAWLAGCITPAGKLAIEDERNGVPEDQRRGTSIMPLFPLMPILMWGAAWGLDLAISPWGSRSFLLLHVVMLTISVYVIVRDVIQLRRIKTDQAESGRSRD